MMEVVNLIKIYYNHICKYHNVPPVQLLCANINIHMGHRLSFKIQSSINFQR
jgi:hypothetical protein